MKKIISTILALAMVGAMSLAASAATVYNTDGTTYGTGGFYALWEDTNGDGTVDSNDNWTAAPYGMYDMNIAKAVYNGDGTVTITLQEGTFNITNSNGDVVYTVKGSITSMYDAEKDEDLEYNLVSDNTVTLTIGREYYYNASENHKGSTLKFLV